MTYDKKALQELKEAVKSVEYATMGHTLLCRKAFGEYAQLAVNAWHPKQYSLDAAISLLEAVLPGQPIKLIDNSPEYLGSHGWCASINWPHVDYKPNFTAPGPFAHVAWADTPSRALLLAILSALIEGEGE